MTAKRTKRAKHRTFLRWKRRLLPWLTVIFGIGFLVLGLRLALPPFLRHYVNKVLDRSKDYSGSIGDVTLHFLRGSYRVDNVNISKTTGKVPVPFISIRSMDLSLQWGELFHGKFVSEIHMVEPKLNFVEGPTKEKSQTGTENDWQQTLENLVPFKINQVTVTNGQVHFRNPYSDPPVDIYIDDVSVVATNFTNTRNLKQKLPAGVIANGRTLGNGALHFEVHVDPFAKSPTFEMTGQLTNVDLTRLNNFMHAYGDFEVSSGEFGLYTSFAAAQGKYDGYAKVFFKHLDVFNWRKEQHENPLEAFWDAIVGLTTTVFQNQPHDQLATKVPITGTFKSTDVHIWPTIQNLLQNAFVRALVPKVGQKMTLQNARNVQPTTKGK